MFVGYPNEKTLGYHFYNCLEQKVFVSKHTIFLEKEFLLRDSESKIELREIQGTQTNAYQDATTMRLGKIIS